MVICDVSGNHITVGDTICVARRCGRSTSYLGVYRVMAIGEPTAKGNVSLVCIDNQGNRYIAQADRMRSAAIKVPTP